MKLKIYEELKTEILGCSKCDLCEEGKIGDLKPQVVGQGNLDAKVMFIAQNPGAEEVKHSQPLTTTGKSGALYEKVLSYLGFTRSQVYTTNVVACHSPKNREPEAYEVVKCKPFLDRQIELVKPELIVTFGRQAAQHFLNDFKISRDHGTIKVSEAYGVKIFTLFHPAYVSCYAPQAVREQFKVDLANLKGIVKELK